MKKLTGIIALFVLMMGVAFADEAANIKINLSGVPAENRYFLCLPDIGCLSIKAAQQGKAFPLYHGFDMNTIFVTDVSDMEVYPQGLPASCNVSVDTNQTITISGHLSVDKQQRVHIDHLQCHLA